MTCTVYDRQFAGYHGLPAIGLVLQEFQNVAPGRFYGNTATPLWEQNLLTTFHCAIS